MYILNSTGRDRRTNIRIYAGLVIMHFGNALSPAAFY